MGVFKFEITKKKFSCSKKMNDGINLIHNTVAMGEKSFTQ